MNANDPETQSADNIAEKYCATEIVFSRFSEGKIQYDVLRQCCRPSLSREEYGLNCMGNVARQIALTRAWDLAPLPLDASIGPNSNQ